jgi:hypothetical protein
MKVSGILVLMFALPVLAQEHRHSSEVINGYETADPGFRVLEFLRRGVSV